MYNHVNMIWISQYEVFNSAGSWTISCVFAVRLPFAHRYEKSVAVWDLVVDDGLYIDRLQLELYGDVNESWKKKTQTNGKVRKPWEASETKILEIYFLGLISTVVSIA